MDPNDWSLPVRFLILNSQFLISEIRNPARPDLYGGRCRRDCLVFPLQANEDLVRTRTAEDVFDRVAAFNLTLAGRVRFAVDRRFRFGCVAPVPLDARAAVCLAVVS